MSARVELALFPDALPKPRPIKHWCPVGFCRPNVGAKVAVDEAGKLCPRHFAKLSDPLARQLGYARKVGGDELQKTLGAAILEARRHDPDWHPWAVFWHGADGRVFRVEGFPDWEAAVRRIVMMWVYGIGGRLRDVALDVELTAEQAAWRCPHRVVDGDVEVRRGWTLSAALFELWLRPFAERERWLVTNEVTGRSLTYARAKAVEEVGHHA